MSDIQIKFRPSYIAEMLTKIEKGSEEVFVKKGNVSILHDQLLPELRVSTAIMYRCDEWGERSFIETWCFSKYPWQKNIQVNHRTPFDAIKVHHYLANNMRTLMERKLNAVYALKELNILEWLKKVDCKYCICGDGTMFGSWPGTCPKCQVKNAIEDCLK